MKRAIYAMMIVVLALGAGACAERVDPGQVGIKVNYYGTDKGVDSYPQVTGMAWYNPATTAIFVYPTSMQTAKWEGAEKTVFNTKEGMQIGVNISLGYQLNPAKVPAFYVKFRSDNLDNFTHGYMRNIARDAFNELAVNYTTEQIYGEKKEEFLAQVKQRINKQTSEYGVVLDQFGVIGAMELPENVLGALNNKIAAIQAAQQAENELRKTQAEAAKQIAQAEGAAKAKIIAAEGEAKANSVLNAALTANVVEWRRLEVQEKTLWRWNGQLPATVVNGNVPFVMPGVK